jgi:alpha-1,6-mannosyltransferase
MSHLRAAWSEFPVKVGLLATAIITLGSLTPAYLPQASPIWSVLRRLGLAGEFGRVFGTILVISGIFALVDAWFRLRHTIYSHLKPLAIVGLWSLPFLCAPAIFSHDAHSYAAQGWMVHNGVNPYEVGPGIVPGLFSNYTPWVWRYTPAPYGPLALQISHLIADCSGGRPWLAGLLMRLPALIAVAVIIHLLPKIAERLGADPGPVTWFACLNPLLVIDYVGGAHNDGWMMGLVGVAIWVATKPRWWPLAALIIGAGAAIKQPAILAAIFLPFFASRVGHSLAGYSRAIGRSLASLGLAIGSFVALSFACRLGFGWITALTVPGSVPSISPSYLLGSLLQWLIEPGGTTWSLGTAQVMMIVGLALIAFLCLRYGFTQPIKALAWSWIVLALAASALHSWYLLWGGLLLPIGMKRRLPWVGILVVILMLCYAGLNLSDRNGLGAFIAAVIAMLAWLGHLVIYHWLGTKRLARQGDQRDLRARADPDASEGGPDATRDGDRDAVNNVDSTESRLTKQGANPERPDLSAVGMTR